MRYLRDVTLHQELVGYQNNKIAISDAVYYHVKTFRQEMQGACRNFYIGGWWPPNARVPVKDHTSFELEEIVKRYYPQVDVFADLNSIFIQGNIHQDLKAWMLKYKDIDGAGYGELRAYYKYYFEILHPEEK